MAESLDAFFEKDLTPGEKILWSGKPQQGFLRRGSDLLYVPISLVICGLALWLEGWIISLLWQVYSLGDGSTTAQLIMGTLFLCGVVVMPLVLIGLFLAAGRFGFDRLRRRKTFYLLTEKRVLICSTLLKRRVRSITLDNKLKTRLIRHSGGRGSITLTADIWIWWILVGPAWWIPFWPDVEVYQAPFLERIEDAERVYQKIRELTNKGV
jgi:hypothetical protein